MTTGLLAQLLSAFARDYPDADVRVSFGDMGGDYMPTVTGVTLRHIGNKVVVRLHLSQRRAEP